MSIALSPDDAWREMRLHIEWATGFTLCFVFSDSPALSRALLQRLDDAWRFRTAPVTVIEPSDPATAAVDMFEGLVQHQQRLPGVLVPAWLQLTTHAPDVAWDQARSECLGRLNEGRAWLVSDLARPLVVCLPIAWQAQVAPAAPDLWHLRVFTVTLAASEVADKVPGLDAVVGGPDASSLSLLGSPQRIVAPHRWLVEEARNAWASRPEASQQRGLAAALGDLSAAQLDAGDPEGACASARESLALRRQLREALGESPQVLRDLSISLNNVGAAEAQAGRGEAALAAYRESLALRRQLREALGESPQVLRDLSVSLDNVGAAEAQAGRDEAALAAYRESLALSRQLREALGESPQVLRDLSVSLNKVGAAEAQAGRGEAALAAYRESLALRRQLREALGESPQVLDDLAVSLERMAVADDADMVTRQAAASEAVAIRERLVAAMPDSPWHAERLAVARSVAAAPSGGAADGQ